ncbi:MAG: GNAT family N-acetyltransferase [Clostridiales bacterium]|nr:GNAT family N-acetyltransferase [Clostridiales bacterium]
MSANHPVTYRNITRKDYPALEYFIDALFSMPGDSGQKARSYLNRLYLYDCLYSCTYARAAILGPRIVGLILGRRTQSRKYEFSAALRRAFYTAALHLVRKGRSYYKAYRIFDKTDRQLLYSCPEQFGGELSLIAVDPRFRHQGIGLTLLGGFHKYMLSNDVRQIYLFTDSTCSFSFYDRQRFDRICTCYWPKAAAQNTFAFYLYKFSYF